MSKRTLYLAAFAGALVAAGVWSWPAGPLWQTGPGAGRNAGFSPDGRVLVTHNFRSREPLHLCRWDAATGRLLSRAEIACDKPADPRELRRLLPSADGTFALLGEGVPPAHNPSIAELWTGDWFLHDGITGRRILGPIEGANHINIEYFSADNRWFAAYRGEPRSGVQHLHRLGIYSTETGKCIKELSDAASREGFCQFAPDGNSVAVRWWASRKDGDKRPTTVEIIELPSAHLRRRVEFPRDYFFVRWDGRFLTAVKHDAEPAHMNSQIIFDLEQNPLGDGFADPLCRDVFDDSGKHVRWVLNSGSEWLAYFNNVWPGESRPGIAGWVDGLTVRLGWARDMTKENRANVWTADRTTGQARYTLPRPVPLSLRFSDDGKLLACGEDSIEVWDADPPPRWPKAIAWGFIAAGTVIVLGRWRKRSAKPPSHGTSSPSPAG
jgi:hypothetical protein